VVHGEPHTPFFYSVVHHEPHTSFLLSGSWLTTYIIFYSVVHGEPVACLFA